jgi:hypothetical protein
MTDADGPVEQARRIVNALLSGEPALLDAKDVLELITPDVGPIKEVGEDIDSDISLVLGLPISWVTGKQSKGLGDSGDADARSIDRGLEPYFWESIHPAFSLLFGTKLTLQQESNLDIATGIEAAKTFDLIGDDMIDIENKREILCNLFDVKNTLKGKPADKPPAPIAPMARPGFPAPTEKKPTVAGY